MLREPPLKEQCGDRDLLNVKIAALFLSSYDVGPSLMEGQLSKESLSDRPF
jgi:hypothetical protein